MSFEKEFKELCEKYKCSIYAVENDRYDGDLYVEIEYKENDSYRYLAINKH